jgi:hypothetical protein
VAQNWNQTIKAIIVCPTLANLETWYRLKRLVLTVAIQKKYSMVDNSVIYIKRRT